MFSELHALHLMYYADEHYFSRHLARDQISGGTFIPSLFPIFGKKSFRNKLFAFCTFTE